MVRQYVIPTAFAIAFAGAAASAQSTGQQQTPPAQPQQQATAQAETRTVEGCVYREEDIPGRSPNIAERAGILEDYILVASADASTRGAVGTTGTAGAAGAAAAAATPKMFKLEHEDNDKLKAMVGKRVRVTGKADVEPGDVTATGQPARDRSLGPDDIELPEFEVTTIAEATGECPAKPEIKRDR